MSTLLVLQLALVVLSITLMLLGGAIAVRRLLNVRANTKRVRAESAVRPLLLRMLAEDEPDISLFDDVASSQIEVLEALVWQMLDKVRGSARSCLVDWLQISGAIERAQRSTQSRSRIKRAYAAEHLGKAGIASTSGDVERLLTDVEAEVRIVATRALGKLGDPRSVPALLDALCGARQVPAGAVSMALLHIGHGAVGNLIAGLGHGSEVVRSVAASLLGMHGAVNATRWLILMVEHDVSTSVRVQATNALGRVGSPNAIETLCNATAAHQPAGLRVEATRSLGRLGAIAAIPVLRTLIDDGNVELVDAAAQALAEMGAHGAQALDLVAREAGHVNAHAGYWLARQELGQASRRSRRLSGTGAP